MVSRKLSYFDKDGPESCMEGRTRRRREIEPLGFGFQLPPLQPPVNTGQDSRRQNEMDTMFVYIHPSPEQQFQPPLHLPQPANEDQEPDPETELTMYSYGQKPPPEQPQPVTSTSHASATRRNRRKQPHAPHEGKSPVIPPPFPWAKNHRAQVHSLKYLTENLIKTISGDVECKRCQKTYRMEYNLEEKYKEVSDYVETHMYDFHDRAPPEWMTPVLPRCNFCHQENSMKPVVKKKKAINWLFLFLGQMLGCCTLGQLKYFRKYTGNHRTRAKDRVLFLTYIELCKQVNRIDEPGR